MATECCSRQTNCRLYSLSPLIPLRLVHFLSFIPLSLFLQARQSFLTLDTSSPSNTMGENWFQREFLTPRRLAFNALFYGSQLFFFILGWYLQVRL